MIIDQQNEFSDAQAITGTADSTNIIDLGVQRDIAPGEPIPLFISVAEDFDNLTDLTVTVVTDADEAFSDPTTLATSGAVALADLVAGYTFDGLRWIPGKTERYLKLTYTVNGTAPTAGQVDAAIVAAHQRGHNY